ncbi:MAG: glycosyltransferase [Planctomycetota bacterium]
MLNGPHIVFAGGGALGNLYPGFAIAKHLEQRLANVQVTFAGDGRAVERHLVRGEGYNYVAMPGRTAPTGPLEAVRFVTDNVAGFWASRWMVREQQVSLVFGMGGCASSAMVRAAHGRGIPFMLLEQSAVASRITRRMAHAAEAVCGAFEAVQPHLPVHAPFVLTGTPGRPTFETLHASRTKYAAGSSHEESTHLKRLVVIGGTDRSNTLNESTPDALANLVAELDGWQVVHQTGEGHLQETEQRYRTRGVDALVVSHIDELASLLSETDLVLCRSGGTMLAELSLAGVPAVLVPASDDDGDQQLANARIYAESTSCPVIDESQAVGGMTAALQQELRTLLVDSTRRRDLAAAFGNLARPDAAEQIAEIICDVLCGSSMRMAA